MASGDVDLVTKGKGGRPAKYDWDDPRKREICYKLYVEEEKGALEIIDHFAGIFKLERKDLPCQRSFLRQFRAWGFPKRHKRLSVEEEAAVTARVIELWQQNMTRKDIQQTLADELDYDVPNHDFSKIWQKHNLRRRNDHAYRDPIADKGTEGNSKKRKANGNAPPDLQVELEGHAVDATPPPTQSLTSEEAFARAQRLLQIQKESDERMASRKRRRRIRGFSHLPADPAGTAPRYASETSLDECKAYLSLSNDMYQAIRQEYQTICESMGIIKKTQCAVGVWEESKSKLIRENVHLSSITHPLQENLYKKVVALECICADVTKRMRVSNNSTSIPEANNILGLNPAESKAARRAFYEILTAVNFESRLISGEEEWKRLRQRVLDTNDKLLQAASENNTAKKRAIDILCKDAMKRFREDKNKRGERLMVQSNSTYGPGPGPAWSGTAPRSKAGLAEKEARNRDTSTGLDPSLFAASPRSKARNGGLQINEPRVRAAVEGHGYPPQPNGNLIGTLAQATGDIDFSIDPALDTPPARFAPPAQQEPRVLHQPVPSYFKLATNSSVTGHHPKVWVGKLTEVTIAALHQIATSKAGGSRVVKINGVVKNNDDTEDSYQIDDSDELQAYLDAAGKKPTFVVLLEGGYA